ncbi:hypothetical protein [Micromonospora sp. bgisy143]|uniref:hypothetical protein n=1 Tax=Micromonospora sp. bgisy143 TaxID=3413790 RepID=UPI003EBF7FB7
MTGEATVTRLDLGPERWLTDGVAPAGQPGHLVAELLPAGYEVYLRLFHPFTSWRVPGRRTWRSLAGEAGVTFHREIVRASLKPALLYDERGHRYEVVDGHLEPVTRAALYRRLSATGDKGPVFFYYGLSAIVRGIPPLLWSAPLDAGDEVQRRADAVAGVELAGPEYVWPADRSWIVNTDYDLTSTYLACSRMTAPALEEDPMLEILRVDLDTRVDDGADQLNGVRTRGEP